MQPARISSLALMALFLLSPVTVWAGDSAAALEPVSGEVLAILQTLGTAYAADAGLALETTTASLAGRVTEASVMEWVGVLESALAVGYAPPGEVLRAISFHGIKEYMTIEMGGSRTPSEVVREVLAPSNSVVQVAWTFAGAPPVTSYAVFSPVDEPLFDTLLFMPVITIPLDPPGHF